MKKNLLLLVLALIGMGGFTACNNEDELLVQEQTETKPVVIRATIGNVSRLALGDSEGGQTKLSWGTGDAFALTIGGDSYTFEWVSGNDFECDAFPATFETAGTITATYPATAADELATQSGKKDEVGKYMQMTAELAVTAGQSTTNLNLSFNHKTSVVEIALEKSELASKSVVVDLRTITASKYSTPAEEGVLSFDSNGKLTVYFVVSPTDETIKDWHIGVKDIAGNDYYTATLSEMKLAASKMYKVSKDALTPSYLVSDDGKTVTAYNAIGLYKWAEMATEDLTNNVVNLELGDDITLPTDGITLDADDLPETSNWTPVGNSTTPYKGNIDGNNKTISNMYIVDKTTAGYYGFLRNSDKVTIQNLKFDGAKIVVGQDGGTGTDGGGYTGVISGVSKANFSNCHVTNSTVKCLALGTNSQMVGGLVGQLNAGNNAGKITNSSFSAGTVEGYHSVGGIVGSLRNAQPTYFSSVTNCTAAGTVTGAYGVGGIAGSCYSYIEECTNNATVNGAASGGIVGHLNTYGCVVGCTNNGEINGKTSVDSKGYGTGGIVGHIHSETTIGNDTKNYVIGCRNLNANVTLTTLRSGGIVGNQKRALSGVYGSYTVKSDVDNAFQSWWGQNPNGATNGTNDVFDSATGTDLTADAVTALNTAIENAFTAMNTAPKSPYVSSSNYNTYKDYRWSWTSGSWPEFKASVAP